MFFVSRVMSGAYPWPPTPGNQSRTLPRLLTERYCPILKDSWKMGRRFPSSSGSLPSATGAYGQPPAEKPKIHGLAQFGRTGLKPTNFQRTFLKSFKSF